jgi:hypothetical protein
MDQRVKLSLFKRTAELIEDGEVVAVRTFGTDQEGVALLKRAVELGQNHPALVALLWPERLDSNGHGRT